MKILIAGSDINAVLLAEYIKFQNPESVIFVTTEEQSENYTCININENDVNSLCDFVKYNQIEFTLVTSQAAIINGIADKFKEESFPVIAPPSEAARVTFFNSIAKKIMYKLKIATPKFGIFDRENIAVDYIRRSTFPIVIENDFTLPKRESKVYKSFSAAKTGLQKIFENNNEKIVIENYIESEPLYLYFITDGFNALPLITLERHSGVYFTSFSAPSAKISEDIIIRVLQNVIYPLLDDISKYTNNYSGIIGLKLKLKNNNYYILEFYNGFQEYDLQVFLSISEENMLNISYDAANGSLADNHDFIYTNGKYSYTIALNKDKIIKNDDDNDFIVSTYNKKIIFTNTASTLNHAKQTLLGYLETVCEEETYKEIINAEKTKICRI